MNDVDIKLIDWVKVLCPTRHKVGHFGDVLPSQSLGPVLKTVDIKVRCLVDELNPSVNYFILQEV